MRSGGRFWKRVRRGIVGLASLAVLAGVALVIFVATVDVDRYRDDVARLVSEASGWPVRIEGRLDLVLGLHPIVGAHDVEVRSSHPDWTEPLARLDEILIHFDLWAAIRWQELELSRLEVSGVDLRLERDAVRGENWSAAQREEEPGSESGIRLRDPRVVLRDITVQYRDAERERGLRTHLEVLELQQLSASGGATLRARGDFDGTRLSAEGELGRHCSPRSHEGAVCEYDFHLSDAGRGRLRATGSLIRSAEAPRIQLDLDASMGSVDELVRFIEAIPLASARVGAQEFRALLASRGLAEDATAPPLQDPLLALSPLHLTARIDRTLDRVRMESIEAVLGSRDGHWFDLRGEVDWTAERTRVDLELQGGSHDLHGLLDGFVRPMPALDRTRATARLHGPLDDLVLQGLRVEAEHEDRVTFVVESGDVHWKRAPDTPIALKLSVRDSDLAALGNVMGVELPPLGPLGLTATLDVTARHVRAPSVQLTLGESQIEGVLDFHFAVDERPSLHAELRAPLVRMIDLGIKPPARASGEAEPERRPLDLAAPLDLQPLRAIDLDGVLRVDRLVGRNRFDLRDLLVSFEQRDSLLVVDELSLAWEEGEGWMALRVDARQEPLQVSTQGRAQGIVLDRLISQISDEPIFHGDLELGFDIEGRGGSGREILAALAGDLFLHAREGGIATQYSRKLQLDLLRDADPEWRGMEFEAMNCFVSDWVLTDGRAEVQLALLDTDDKQVLMAGWIDLGASTMDLELVPALKEAVPGSMTTAVRLKGPLNDPKVRFEPLMSVGVAAEAIVNQALRPVRRWIPGSDAVLDTIKQGAEDTASSAGIDLSRGAWRPGIDMSCEIALSGERIARARSLGRHAPTAPAQSPAVDP